MRIALAQVVKAVDEEGDGRKESGGLANDLYDFRLLTRYAYAFRDKKRAARFGRWEAFIDDLHTPYKWSQENGNRSDVHWVKLRASSGRGPALEVRMERPFNFSLRKYATGDLDQAKHPHELTELDEAILNLDAAHHGLGSGSCGPLALEGDRLRPESFDFTVGLRATKEGSG